MESTKDVKERLQLAVEVRDAIEVVNSSSEYPKFIAAFMPALTAVLESTPAQLSDGPEHKLRNTTLEILNRMPHTEALRPFDKQVLKLAMDALKAENEENALICLRIIFDLHRNFRPNLESEVAPFLEFVCDVYKNIGDTVKEVFGDEGGAKPAKEAPAASATPSTKSFKVMTECPLIVMLLFQLYSRLIPPNIQTLLPLMVQTIGLKGPKPDDVPAHLRAAFGDLKGSQVKMVSFVTYLLRGYSEAIQPHQEAISQSIVDLLRSCPDNVATRKELLVATRHVLSAQDFRRGFYTHLDALLDEEVLIGTGRACYDALRPLAYSFLAELVHHMRLELTLPQIRRTVYVFSRNVQDNSLPLSIQMTCVRLMHHLVESIFRRRNDPAQAQEARANLIRILDTTVSKFRTVRPQVKTLLENAKAAEAAEARAAKRAQDEARAEEDAAAGIVAAPKTPAKDASKAAEEEKKDTGKKATTSKGKGRGRRGAKDDDDEVDKKESADKKGSEDKKEDGKEDVDEDKPIVGYGGVEITPTEAVKRLADTKALVKTLVIGMKTLLWSVTNFFGQQSQQMQMGAGPAPVKGFREGELRRASGFVANGVRCLALFQGTECAEMCTHFAEALAVLDPRNFVDVICLRIDALLGGGEPYELAPMVQLPHLLLQSSALGRSFADALATHLVRDRLGALAEPASPQSQLVLKLFSLLMHAVSKYSSCEAVLSPHVATLVESCLKAVKEVDDPSAYVRLLRYLFRALAQAKFDLLYREVVPVLQPCLDTLLTMLHGPDTHELNDTIVELCLTLPARLSSILPHLPRLAHPLLRALKSTSSELQLLGLRTLEFWVDSLNPDFLDPCIAEVEPQLMLALWALLKPQQSGAPFGAKALQMLGKLGGRSRCFLREPLELEAKQNPEHGLRLILTFKPETSFLVPLDRCIQLMRTILQAPPVPNLKGAEALVEHRRRALAFLRTCLASVLNLGAGLARTGAGEEEVKRALEGVVAGWFTKIEEIDDDDEDEDRDKKDSDDKKKDSDDKKDSQSKPEGEKEKPKPRAQLGNKTKTQLEAERAVFRQLLVAVVAAEADPTLKEANDGFVDAVAEHFAMLFVSGVAPLQPGGSGRSGAALAKERAIAKKARLAIKEKEAEEEEEAKAKKPPPRSPRGKRGKAAAAKKKEKEEEEEEDKEDKEDEEMADADDDNREVSAAKRAKRAAASLRQLDATLFLDALMEALESGKRPHMKAALRAVQTFIDGVMTLACDSAVTGVSEEEAEQAKEAVAVAKASIEREEEEEKRRKENAKKGFKPETEREDADVDKMDVDKPEVKEEDVKKEDESKDDGKGSAKKGGKKGAKADDDAVADKKGEDTDGEKKEGDEDKDEKAEQKPDPAKASAAAALVVPIPPALKALVAELLPRLMHACFQKNWQATVGGVAGIDALTRVLPISALRANLPKILQALLSALQLLPPHAVTEVAAATKLFHRVLETATPEGVDIRGEDAPPGVEAAVAVLSEELFSTTSSPTVRPVVEAAVMGLSKRSGLDVNKVLDVKPAHAQALLARPLRSKHVNVQTQVVHIVNFCLSARPAPIMSVNAQTVGLLQEALVVAENDDPNTFKGGPGAADSLHALRAACIRLICSAMAHPELKTPPAGQEQLAQLRQRIITMFFKSLTSRNADIVEIAKQGLKRVIQQQSLSKELLQSSLRPILVNLAHYKNLTMPLLVGLERLLELLSNWFNPTLGEKLLEHLRRWLDPEQKMAPGGQQQPRPAPKDFKIAAAMINLFHLLPPAASKFLEQLVMMTVSLERALPQNGVHSEVNSLYRKPLCKFLSRYAPQAVDFFLAKLAQGPFFFRFIDMIRMEKEGENLREELAKSASKISAAAFTWPHPSSGDPAANASEGLSGVGGGSDLNAYNGLKLIVVLAKRMPDWLSSQPDLVKALWQRWNSDARQARLKSEEALALPELLESKQLVKCFLNVAAHDRTRVAYLFDILTIFSARSRVDYTFVEEFYKEEVAVKWSPEERHAVIVHFLDCFKERSLEVPELVNALKLIVLPVLEHTLKDVAVNADKMEEATKVITEDVVHTIVMDVLETADDESSPAHADPLRIQLLRMGTLLIRNLPDELVRHRKELIKFGWNHLKSEDVGSKQWAFVNVCHFLEAYQAPEKIVLQVFVALLRACQPEAKELVRQALGALVPALPKRLPQGDHKYPIWIRYTKKILVEEGHSMPALIHVWNLIHTQETLFFPSRAQFVPQMVNSLSRLGLPSSSPTENRVLSIKLVELILRWEERRKRLKAEAAEKGEGEGEDDGDDGEDEQPKKSPRAGSKRGRDADTRSSKRTKGADGKATAKDEEEEEEEEEEEAPKKRSTRGSKKEEPILPESAEKGDADMADVEDIDIGDGKSDKDKAAPASAADVDDFSPTPAMEEILVNFLVRMSFLTGEAKDREMVALHQRAVTLLKKSLRTWPHVNIKFAFIEKLLASAKNGAEDATRTLPTGLGIFNIALECGVTKFVSGNAPQLAQMLEPCFESRRKSTHDALAKALARAMFPANKPLAGAVEDESGRPVPPAEAKLLQNKLDELCAKHVASAITGNPALPNVQAPNPSLACVLACIAALAERQRRIVDRYLPHLIKLLSRLTHELNAASAAGAVPQQQPARALPGQSPAVPVPDYGSVAHCMAACVRLIASRVIPAGGEHKQLFLRMLLQLINDQATHGAVLMATLDALKGWAEDAVAGAPPGAVGAAAAIPAGLVKPKPEPGADGEKAAGDDDDAKDGDDDDEDGAKQTPTPKGGKTGPTGAKLKPGEKEKDVANKDADDDGNVDVEVKEEPADDAKGEGEEGADDGDKKPPSTPSVDPASPDPNRPGSLSAKETVLFLSKLAHLTRMGREVTQTAEWEEKLLGTLYALCAAEGHHDMALRQEVFSKVERNHLLGLRSRRPDLHGKFFKLYDGAVGNSLFHRLQYILAGQEWDAMADTFWLKQGLDLILSTLADEDHITLAPNSAQCPPLLPVNPTDPKAEPPKPPEKKPSGYGTPNEKTAEMLARHAAFMTKIGALRVKDLVGPLREVATRNAHMSYYLWVLIYPIVWATLQREEQMQLAKPMIALLSKEYHQRQAAVRPNVVQALLEGISLSQPQPKIPSELIKFLGKTYNAWHIAVALLENHVVRYPQEARCFDALAELYRLLGERDALVGLWRQRCNSDVTRAGLALTQHGHWQEANDVFFRGMQRASAGQVTGVTKTELCLWETNWLNSAKQLNQWELVADFSRSVEHTEMQLNSLWRMNDWVGLKDLLPQSPATSEVEETPEICIIRVYSALNSGRVNEAEQYWKQAVKLLLDRWWKLPETGAAAHIPVLHSFHVMVELQESTRILVELSNAQRPQHQNPGHCRTLIQDVMETWRLRTPNRWDPVPWWNEVLSWRGYMYGIIATAAKSLMEIHPQLMHQGHQLDQLGLRDRAWGINKLAGTARHHRMGEVANIVLTKQQRHIEVQEAFSKLREQSKACLEMEGETITGLNALEGTSLDFFHTHHKAELFRLKGLFQERMGDGDGAHQSYATALSLCKQLSKAWITWGEFCSRQATQAATAAAAAAAAAGATGAIVPVTAADEDGARWVEYCATCYLQAVKHGPQRHRHELVNVLHQLAFSDHTNAVGRALEKHLDAVQRWVWIPFVPQLLLSLLHREAPHVKALLLRLAQGHPQAMYCPLRTFLLERREAATRVTQTARQLAAKAQESGAAAQKAQGEDAASEATRSAVAQAKQDQAAAKASAQAAGEATVAFEGAKEVMERLRHKHSHLVTELEVLLSELGARFASSPEERLLVVVYTLLHRCYKYPTATTAEVPASFKKELTGVCRACFSADTSTKHADFVAEYKADYERDLDPEQPTFPSRLSELIERLKRWKRTLQADVEDRLPATLRLEDESPQLRGMHFVDVEVPGQYSGDAELTSTTDGLVKLERISCDVHVVRRHGNSYRCLTFLGADGSEKRFLVQTSLTPAARGEERMLQLLGSLNASLLHHVETRRRGLAYYTPAVVPVWPQVRLMEDDAAHCTYGEVYEINCARYGREADLPISLFKQALDDAVTGKVTGPEAVLDLRLKAFSDIAQNHVTENIFSHHMYKTLPTGSHLWTFKRQLTHQHALSCFVSALLRLGGRTPQKIMFAKNTGRVFMLDFHPAFDSKGITEFVEPVPFRLTRNLYTFFTPFGVRGDFVAAMAAAAQAMSAPGANIETQMMLFYRDQLMVWPWRRMSGAGPQALLGPTPADVRVMARANVDEVMKRLPCITPNPPRMMNADHLTSVQKGVIHLVEASINPKNLCRQEPTAMPWL